MPPMTSTKDPITSAKIIISVLLRLWLGKRCAGGDTHTRARGVDVGRAPCWRSRGNFRVASERCR
jgi:hypothetical protein